MADMKDHKPGTAIYNPNKPLRNNPYISIPADLEQNPFRLVWIDICSVCKYVRLLPLIVWPLRHPNSTPLGELYPTAFNIADIFLQSILLISQLFLLLTIPIVATIIWFLPNIVNLLYFSIFFALTAFLCRLLNGGFRTECLVGMPQNSKPVNDDRELWFFINGICIGKHWLQSNLTQLARIFQREIVGIHNPTKGLLLDLIECLIQRDLNYQTADIRQGRAQIRAALVSPSSQKVVLILHSQGGIEGSMILDALYTDVPPDQLGKLEVFTFGNAARHFNNPVVVRPCEGREGVRAIPVVEHYANSEDFVARIGVVGFTSPITKARAHGEYLGKVFTRMGTGHLLNMHYLDTIFAMEDGRVKEEGNVFMNSKVEGEVRVKDISRLWQYRNGRRPIDGPCMRIEMVEETGIGAERADGREVEKVADRVNGNDKN